MPHGFSTDERREQETLTTLFDLGRQVTAVLDLDELRAELRVAYSIGYPDSPEPVRLTLDKGLVGAAVKSHMPLLVNDVISDPRYLPVVAGMAAELVVPLM